MGQRIGLDGTLVLPLGDYADAVDFAAGALLRYELDLMPQLSVTGRIGYIYHAANNRELGFVPIMAGAEYRFSPGPSAAYVRGELGITIAWSSVDTGLGSASDTDSELGLTIGGGYDLGTVDLGAALYLPDADDLVGLMVTVGVDLVEL